MPTSYYTGSDVVKIDTHGVPRKQASVSVNVYNVTDSASLGTVSADAHGVVASGSLSIDAGKTVRFSVTGYTPVLERITTPAPDYLGHTELSLILQDSFTPPTPTAPAYNEIWARQGEGTQPQMLGTVEPGGTLKIPWNPAEDQTVDLFAIARTDRGESNTFDLINAVKTTVELNRAVETPTLTQLVAATNTQVTLGIANYLLAARYRKIEVADNSGFTGADIIVQDALNLGGVLPTEYLYTKAGESSAVARYFRVSHSTNGMGYSPVSATLTVTFASSGGNGGSSGATPPTLDSADWNGTNTVTLGWTPHGGSGQYTLQRRFRLYLEGGFHWGSWSSWTTLSATISASATSTTDSQSSSVADKEVEYRLKRNDVDGYSNSQIVFVDGSGGG